MSVAPQFPRCTDCDMQTPDFCNDCDPPRPVCGGCMAAHERRHGDLNRRRAVRECKMPWYAGT